ncbi:unnamed protein product [Amaranthus hypochondriacus]
MASSQQVANISEKNMGILIQLKNEIKSSKAAALDQSQASTIMNMTNMGVGKMTVHAQKDWSGSVLGIYPNMDRYETRNFIHRATPPKDPLGSYGCVIYAGPNVQGGAVNCAWVLAWRAPGDGSKNQVYVKTGLLSQYPKDDVDWAAIKTSLDGSGNTSQTRDPTSGAEASAIIDESGNIAAASALFTVSL